MDRKIVWNNLTYRLDKRRWSKQDGRLILDSVSGTLEPGRLCAIMGESGVGKTCLLKYLSGHLDSAQVTYHDSGSDSEKRLKMAFLPQDDFLTGELTVRETIMFATQLKNFTFKRNKHLFLVDEVVGKLGLTRCLDTRVGKCSGGERKRVSVACELVSPSLELLLLDEPTSGLDSRHALAFVQLLRDLAVSEQIFVVATVHQPSSKMLALFHQLYILARGSVGSGCIYDGAADGLLPYLEASLAESEPEYTNPAEWAINIASGEQGVELVDQLIALNKTSKLEENPGTKLTAMLDTNQARPFAYHVGLLTKRAVLKQFRNPSLLRMSLLINAVTPLMFYLLFGGTGLMNGCPSDEAVGKLNQFMKIFDTNHDQSGLSIDFFETSSKLGENYALLASSTLVNWFYAFASFITIPLEIKIAQKEHFNGWYSGGAYFAGLTISSLTTLMVSVFLLSSILFYISQNVTLEVYLVAFVVYALAAACSQAVGALVGTACAHSAPLAAYISIVVTYFVATTGGFFSDFTSLPAWGQRLLDLSPIKQNFQAVLFLVYNGRCDYECDLTYWSDSATSVGRLLEQNGLDTSLLDRVTSKPDILDTYACIMEIPLPENRTCATQLVRRLVRHPIRWSDYCDAGGAADPIPLTYFEITQDQYSLWQPFLTLTCSFIVLKAINALVMQRKIKHY